MKYSSKTHTEEFEPTPKNVCGNGRKSKRIVESPFSKQSEISPKNFSMKLDKLGSVLPDELSLHESEEKYEESDFEVQSLSDSIELYNIPEDPNESILQSRYMSYVCDNKTHFNNRKDNRDNIISEKDNSNNTLNLVYSTRQSGRLHTMETPEAFVTKSTFQDTKCDCSNIMIVDDESFNLATLKTQFNVLYKPCGRNILQAINGLEALDLFK